MSEELISETMDDESLELDESEELVSDRIADLVEYLVVNIVDDPDGVSLEVIDGTSSSTIEVTVAEGDVAKVIGRHGRTIKAIRTLARALAARLDTSVEVEGDGLGGGHRVVTTDLLDVATIATRARVGDDDAVVRALLGTMTSEADLDSHANSFFSQPYAAFPTRTNTVCKDSTGSI